MILKVIDGEKCKEVIRCAGRYSKCLKKWYIKTFELLAIFRGQIQKV